MHPKNVHRNGYDLALLAEAHPALRAHLITKPDGHESIDFSDAASVLELNKALLKAHYDVSNWDVPVGYLCPPIPSRVDYILHLSDLISGSAICGLDIGTGANMIYPILGTSIFNWKMVGSEVDHDSYAFAKVLQQQITLPKSRSRTNIRLRLQPDRSTILKNIIKPNEYFDFTMCNPPFYSSEAAAIKANQQKNKGLGNVKNQRNFAGKSHELWCNGGEALFVKRLIKESVDYAGQVGLFTSLIAHKEHLPKLQKLLTKLEATHQVIDMISGQKKSRFLAWRFEK